MKYELDQHNRHITDDELLSDLRRVALSLRKNTVTIDEQNEKGCFHATTLTRRFGGWFSALEKAELQPTRAPLNILEEDLLRNIEKLWITLGRQPRYADVSKPLSSYSAATYANRFGSWRKALETFVEFANNGAVSSELISEVHKRVQLRANDSRHINWRLRFIVMRRDNFKCKICGVSPASNPGVTLHLDHIQAWSKGGETTLDNLQTLCSTCNLGKSDLDFVQSNRLER